MVAAVRVAMARRNMDQTALAAATGMSAAYLSRRLAAQQVFTLYDIERLAGALGLTPRALIEEAVAESSLLDAGDDGDASPRSA